MKHVESWMEDHPSLAWMGSGGSFLVGWLTWLIDHADDFGKVFGALAAIVGFIAGYATMRIQWHKWRRQVQADKMAGKD